MFVDTAVWVGFVFGFLTAWKILPVIGHLLRRHSSHDVETWQNQHRRCRFCVYSKREYCGDWYCEAKKSFVFGSLPRFACPLFKQHKRM